jgi:hypothetical protein
LRSALAVVCSVAITGDAAAQRIGEARTTADNLMVVLREVQGATEPNETMKPFGKMTGKFDGKDIIVEFAWYSYLGDMQIRFVFDSPKLFVDATAEEFARLHLTPEEAVELALENIKRDYGEPFTEPYQDGIMYVVGASPDLDSSFFLDRVFWRGQLARHPEGLVAGVAKRGGLIFAPLSDRRAVALLREHIFYLYRISENLRISSALYLFKDDRWTVFQAPIGAAQ